MVEIEKVGVVGCGLMGSGIAEVADTLACSLRSLGTGLNMTSATI